MSRLTSVVVIAVFAIGACAAAASPTPTGTAAATSTATPAATPAGAAPTPHNGTQFVVAWSPYTDPTNDLNVAFDKQVEKAITDFGAKSVYCSGKAEAQAQANCMDQFIAQKVDYIIVYPADTDSIAEKIKDANKAGIPVASFFGEIPDKGEQIQFSFTNPVYDGGVANGTALVDYLTKKYGSPKGTVLEVTGLMTTSQAYRRNQGFHSVVDKYPDIKVTVKNGDWNSAKAGTIITDWFTANPKTDALFLHSTCDYTPPAVAALTTLGLYKKVGEPGHIWIGGNDGCNQSLYELKCRFHDFIATYPVDINMKQAMTVVVDFLKTGTTVKAGGQTPFGGTVVTYAEIAGPVVLAPLQLVPTQFKPDDPTLFGNSFQSEPNGKTQCKS